MRRIVIWLASTVTVVVLLCGYHTSISSTTALGVSAGTRPPSASSGGNASPSTSPTTTSSSSTAPSTKAPSSSATPSSSSTESASKAYTGTVSQTRWGPVQVKITVASGKITKVDVLQHPSGNSRDAEINGYALPILVDDTLTAQSASIDMVSGATVTSTGYLQSLQAALDDAGL